MPQEADITRANSDSDPVEQQFKVINTSFSDAVRDEINPIASNLKPVNSQEERYKVELDQPKSIKLNGSFLNGNIKFNSLEVADLSFRANPETNTLTDIDGLSLNISVFDSNRIMEVEEVQLVEGENGQRIINAQIENPLSAPLERILGMPDTIRVAVPLTSNGLVTPKLSQVFTDASDSTGPSIAGLLAKDVLNEAAKVSLFVESNPEWVDNVVEPALHEIYANLAKFTSDKKSKPAQVAELPEQNSGHIHRASFSPSQNRVARIEPAVLSKSPVVKKITPGPIEEKHGDHRESARIKDADRKYTVHVPPSYNDQTPMPLVIALHGHAQTGEIIAKNTKLNELSDKEGFIAVYPDARIWAGEEAWRAWDTDNGLLPPGEDADDVSFLRTIIEKTEQDYKIDPKRIYLAGLSNGGMMSFRAAGDLSDKIAAIAVVSGAMGGSEPAPEHQISVLNIHGTADRIVPYNGLKNVPSSLTSIGLPKFKPMQYATDFWVEQNKITNPPIVIERNGVIERRFINSVTGAEVNEYTMVGGRHVPPNFAGITNTVWNFFEAHPKTDGFASGTPQPKVDEPFNITEMVKKHFATRGMKGIEKDVGQMITELHNLEDGSFTPGSYLRAFENKLDLTIDDKFAHYLKATQEVTKSGEHIEIDYDSTQRIAFDIPRSNSIRLNALSMEDTRFRLTNNNNLPSLTEIRGVNAELSAFGSNYSVPIRSASQKLDNNGDPYYRVGTTNPLPGYLQTIMFAKSEVPVDIRLEEGGNSSVINVQEVKDAVLGVNPVTRGYIDTARHTHELFTSPSLSAGLHTTKDVALIGSSTYAGWKLSPSRFGRKGRVGAAIGLGLVVAPSIIHGIERLID